MSKEKLIVALDVPTPDEARAIVADLGGEVGAFKIGLQLFVSAGPNFVRELAARYRVFLDLKFHDIPNTVAAAAAEAARAGVWMLNVHASGGREMMQRAAESVAEVSMKENLARPFVIGVTVLTSSNEAVLEEVGVKNGVADQVLSLAHLVQSAGLDGVVASPLECGLLRRSGFGPDLRIITPGIRIKTATNDDQKRVTTPGAALIAGADYVVVGRPILQAVDRRKAVAEIVGEMNHATALSG